MNAPVSYLAMVPFRAGWFAAATLCYLLLALYGSFVPFQYTPLPWDEVLERWHHIRYLQLGIESRADFVANILLFIPLAYLLMGTLSVDCRLWVRILSFALVVPLLCGLSFAIEFFQIYYPPRTVSLNDIRAESAGGLIGASAWLVAGQRFTVWARGVWGHVRGQGLAVRLLPGYLIFLVVLHLMPFDLTISPAEVYHKWRDGKIVLIPFTTPYGTVDRFLEKTFWNFMYFLPAGLLLAYLPTSWRLSAPVRAMLSRRNPAGPCPPNSGRESMPPMPAPRVLLLGALLAAGIEFLQIFVFTRYFDVTDIITGSLAVWAGWALVQWLHQSPTPAAFALLRRCWFPIWLVLLIYFNWAPFDFDFDGILSVRRYQRMSRIPFADYYWGTEYNAFLNVLHKGVMFAPLGLLLTRGSPARRSLAAGLAVCVLACVIASIIEAGQFFLPARYPSVTDILVETLGAALGVFLSRRLQRPAQFAIDNCQSSIVNFSSSQRPATIAPRVVKIAN